jgi:hypothetical protein
MLQFFLQVLEHFGVVIILFHFGSLLEKTSFNPGMCFWFAILKPKRALFLNSPDATWGDCSEQESLQRQIDAGRH